MKKYWQWIRQLDASLRRGQTGGGVDSLAPLDLQQPAGLSSSPVVWQEGGAIAFPLPPLPPAKPGGHIRRVRPAIAFSFSVLALTAALGQRYYRQPELQVGTIAPKTIEAPYEATVVDVETTENKRAAARNGAVPVLMPDTSVNDRIYNSLNSLFQQADILRSKVGLFPFLNPQLVSQETQHYVRSASPQEWEDIWAVVSDGMNRVRNANSAPSQWSQLVISSTEYQALQPRQQSAVRELMRYQQAQGSLDTAPLQLAIKTARTSYQLAIADLQRLSAAERGLPNTPQLLTLSTEDWQSVQKQVSLVVERMLTQGIAEGVPRELLEVAAASHIQNTVPPETVALAQRLITTVLEPNLIKDPERTREKAEAAAEQVRAVTIAVQEGEIIVRAGEAIDRNAFVLLDYFDLSQRRLNVAGLLGFGGLTAVGAAVFLWVERSQRPKLRWQDHGLLICMVLGASSLSVVGLAVYSLPAVSLLASSFYGATIGTTLVGLVAILLPLGTPVNPIPLLASTAGALLCSRIAPRLRSREELALLGGGVGGIQAGVYLLLTWFLNPTSLATWYLPLTGAILQGLYGVVSSVVALGLSPYLEHLFDLVTPIRLAELSSPNRPMLQRLAATAPGTFQHTVFVASLAEAAARALRCNVELVRAGTLYHDIGKMHDPLGFIENQMGGPNKHDLLDNPWESAEIIKKHVSEGILMARRCRLPKAVRDFIPEHQGTMKISYFFHQAEEKAKADPSLIVREADFRYDGPIPQSPETGIVMLADSCEAALRSLQNASPEEALAMVNRIMKARWQDGQLVDSGLNRDHLRVIAQVFVQVWQQYNHKRIAYPKQVFATTPHH